MGALSPSITGQTPQQLADLIAANLVLLTQSSLTLFVAGSVAPTSDSGPWLMNNTTWRVWNPGTGDYQPQILEPQSLRYILSQNAPDPIVYDLWVIIDSTGKAQGIQHYVSGAWHDVYEDLITDVTYPFRTEKSVIQTIAFTVAPATQTVQLDFGNGIINPNGAAALSIYTAPIDGYYMMSLSCQLEVTGSPTGVEVNVAFCRNGVVYDGAFDSYATAPAKRIYAVNSFMYLNKGDQVTGQIGIGITGGTGVFSMGTGTNNRISGFLVQKK